METNLIPDGVYNNLPEFLLNLTSPFSGRERDIVLLSSLGVISAALPKVFGMYDANKYSPNLYILIIAPPASGKGIMNNSKKLIDLIHQTIKEISLGNIEDCKTQKKKEKDLDRVCPEIEVKVLPGNVSSSKIYKHLKASSYGLLIFETEADTISIMLKQDWGNFSDILRKAFHHETISMSRETENRFIEVDRPELSLVISGTPNQVKPLIQSKENGLFSRFLFYVFNEATQWKDVSPKGMTIGQDEIFSHASQEVFIMYNKLKGIHKDLEIKLSETQWEKFNANMIIVTNLFIGQKQIEMLSTIKRHGLMMFRICMILTILRNKDGINPNLTELICNDLDYDIAFGIMKSTIDHSIEVSNLISKDGYNLPIRDALILDALKDKFQRSEALAVGESMGMPIRTIDFTLNKWTKNKVVTKVSTGIYQKINK